MTRCEVTKRCNKCVYLLPGAFNAILLIIRQRLLKYGMTFKGLNKRHPSVCLHVCAVSTTKARMYLEKTKAFKDFNLHSWHLCLTTVCGQGGCPGTTWCYCFFLLSRIYAYEMLGEPPGEERCCRKAISSLVFFRAGSRLTIRAEIEWSKMPLPCETPLKPHVWAKWKLTQAHKS